MTRYTLMLFQSAYPEQIKIDKAKAKDGIRIECWLLKCTPFLTPCVRGEAHRGLPENERKNSMTIWLTNGRKTDYITTTRRANQSAQSE